MALHALEQITQVSTRQKVHSAIKEAILAGKLKTGARITETELAESFNVSRAVVREALQQLTHEGLIEQNPYKGTRVVRLSLDQLEEISQVRLLLETEAVRLAKARIAEADKRALRSLFGKLKNARSNTRLYAELDLKLHEKIWEISGNETLTKLLTQVVVPLFAMGTIIRYSKTFAEENVRAKRREAEDMHDHLVRIICDGTTDQAVRAMREHLTENSSFTRRNFERFLAAELDSAANHAAAKTPARKTPTGKRKTRLQTI